MSNHHARFALFSCILAAALTPALAQNLSGPPAAATPAATAPVAGAPPNPPPGAAVQEESGPANGVAAVVNDAIITEYDLHQRILLYLSTSGQAATPETIAKLRNQVLQTLETEQLQIQEARRKGITVSPTDVDKSIERIIGDNKMTKEQLAELLAKGGVEMATLRAQIAVQLAWQRAVQDEFQDRINITQQDVDAELARLKEGADKPHFLVSAIFLSVENPDMDAKVLKDAQDIYAQLQAGAQFSQVARELSQSPTAASGGDMGLVYQGQLPAELDTALQKMDVGTISPPLRAIGGYYILGLRGRQEGMGARIPNPATIAKPQGPLTVARLLLPIGPKPPKNIYDNVMKLAIQLHDHVSGCDLLPKMQEQVHGLVYQDLAKMGLKISDLAPEIQAAIAKAGPGEATPPFSSPAGIEMMVRCDKRAPPPPQQFTLPSRQAVEESLFDEQISMLSRRYLRDLRRSANVEAK